MKYENSLTIFIFSLIVSMFLYVIRGISSPSVKVYAGIIAVIVFSIALIGLLITSLLLRRSLSTVYYLLLFLASLMALTLYIISDGLTVLIQYYFALTVLIGLLISLLDFRQLLVIKSRTVEYFRARANEAKLESRKLQDALENQKSKTSRLQDELKENKQSISKLNNEKRSISRNLDQAKRNIGNMTKRIENLNKSRKNATAQKKTVAQLKKEQQKFQRALARSQKQAEYQAELKSKYSKTLSNIRKRKKEEEELLVISSDGKSVHKPKCIVVRNVPKESRKLIKNWQVAKKQGLKGCKLCKPHTKDSIIQNNHIKYKFVASKESDKIHAASCILVKNIAQKDRLFFKNYKAALKKGYTACRICNSGNQ